MNKERLKAIVNRIIDNPDCWQQQSYHSHCRTAHCVAGHAEIDAGYEPNSSNVTHTHERARKWLELTEEEADWLFAGDRKFSEIYSFTITEEIPRRSCPGNYPKL